MRSGFRRSTILLSSLPLLFWCSCDKHKVGELPEVQREHVDLMAKGGSKAEASPAASPKMGSTPAEFFSPAKKSP
jgi:hypothetical protein